LMEKKFSYSSSSIFQLFCTSSITKSIPQWTSCYLWYHFKNQIFCKFSLRSHVWSYVIYLDQYLLIRNTIIKLCRTFIHWLLIQIWVATEGDVRKLASHINALTKQNNKIVGALKQYGGNFASFLTQTDKRISNAMYYII
jgi:hypothetical protein